MALPRSTRRRVAWILALALLLVAAATAGARWVSLRQGGEQAAVPASGAGDVKHAADSAGADAPRGAAPAASSGRYPGGLGASQWQTISDRIEPGPEHDRELARIGNLMEFEHSVERLRDLRGDPAAADERRRLAREIDAGIEAHLALRETTGAEAVLLKSAVLDETVADPAQRAAQLEAFRQQLASANPPERDPRVADYLRQEAAIVADWQSHPASQRDPVALARRLQQLQVAVFNPGL
jgi:hypothetical protein